MGLAYTSASLKKKKIPARQMGPTCTGCKFTCSAKFSEDERQAIFKNYWGLGELQRQQFIFIFIHIKSNTHKYLVKGHTQNKGDMIHSLIEKKVKRFRRESAIFHPDQYFSLMRSIKLGNKNFQVFEMGFTDFYDVKLLKVINLQGAVKIEDISIIRITKKVVEYKDSYLTEGFTEIKPLKGKKKKESKPKLTKAYTERLKISEKKKEGIMSLFKKTLYGVIISHSTIHCNR